MRLKSLVLALALATAGTAGAQTFPRPAEFYFDADANATRPVVAIDETGEAAMAKLLAMIERKRQANAEAAQLAHMAMEAGREEIGRALYQRALQGIDGRDAIWRPIKWNQAWDLYRTGDAQAALEAWHELVTSRGVTASWMPHTLALALWSVDRRDEAVSWYAAAVRTEPQQWRDTSRYDTLLADWTPAERARLAEVHAAWAADPPAYP